MNHAGVTFCLLAIQFVISPSSAAVCPTSCVCTTTPDGLHKATCSSIGDLYKFTLRQKHHNINVLDLSHNNITLLTHQLDRLTEVVSLDLSTNGLSKLGPFMHNAKKVVHINLANNRIDELSVSFFPKSVSSLDLTNNLLRNIPSDIGNLLNLEHLEMEGNPLDCSCENIIARDLLTSKGILIDHVKCISPFKFKGSSWLELKTSVVCHKEKRSLENDYFGKFIASPSDDAIMIGEETTRLKRMPMQAASKLEEGQIWDGSENTKADDDDIAYIKAPTSTSPTLLDVELLEGSGFGDDADDRKRGRMFNSLDPSEQEKEEIFDSEINPTDDPLEGSGDYGSGFSGIPFGSNPRSQPVTEDDFENEDDEFATSTTEYKELYTEAVQKFLGLAENTNDGTKIPEHLEPKSPGIYMGPPDWYNSTSAPSTEKPIERVTQDTTVSEKIQIKEDSEVVLGQPSQDEGRSNVNKTGTYICIVIIVVLLVGLIGFAIVKGQIRKRRDRRLLRQRKGDIEKASKEMVDMNKSLLGKPANSESPNDKKVNGKYELVPTHETPIKKSENGNVPKKNKENDFNQNKSSPKDSNQHNEEIVSHPANPPEIKLEVTPVLTDSKKERDSLSSDDIFVPLSDATPRFNGITESDVSQPLINGDQNTDSDYLSPSQEYVPVYSPDMGRVRIKMTEIPKPKTPVLVTRSRSNAGEIIITPSGNDSTIPKSTT